MEGFIIFRQTMCSGLFLVELMLYFATPSTLARFAASPMLDNKLDSYNNAVDHGPGASGPLDGRAGSPGNRSSMIPSRVLDTMMRLIEKGAHGHSRKGDTIRAYTPLTTRICDGQVVSLFNIRLHPLSEDLRAIELHYYKLPESTRHGGDNFQVVLWAFGSSEEKGCARLGALDLRVKRRGYQTTDVTSELTGQFDYLPEAEQFGVSFRTRDADDESAEVNRLNSATASVSAQPFILVHTNQRKRSTIGALHKSLKDSAQSSRTRRALIPNMDLSNHIGPVVPPRQVLPIEQQVNRGDPRSPVPETTNAAARPNQLSFEYFNDQNKLRRKMLRKRRKQLKHGIAVSDEGAQEILTNDLPLPASEGRCQRHPLLVNFRDLGWDDFVIAPLVYDATYCAGTCAKTEDDGVSPESPTNYAAILNVMGALGVAPVPLPTPCCAPEKMSSMSLLYFDENSDISLKTFTDMIVNSCSCR